MSEHLHSDRCIHLHSDRCIRRAGSAVWIECDEEENMAMIKRQRLTDYRQNLITIVIQAGYDREGAEEIIDTFARFVLEAREEAQNDSQLSSRLDRGPQETKAPIF